MDLRRLMFWHGRSFALKEFWFIQLIMFRSISYVTSYALINGFNQFSAINCIDGLLYALFNINMTIFFINFWTLFDVDLKNGKQINFSLATYYEDCRDFVRNYFRFYAMNGSYAILCGIFIFSVGMIGFTSDLGDGKQQDLITFGVMCTSTHVVLFHVMIALIVRDWNPMLIFFFIFSLANLPITQWGNNSMPSSWVYKAVFG